MSDIIWCEACSDAGFYHEPGQVDPPFRVEYCACPCGAHKREADALRAELAHTRKLLDDTQAEADALRAELAEARTVAIGLEHDVSALRAELQEAV